MDSEIPKLAHGCVSGVRACVCDVCVCVCVTKRLACVLCRSSAGSVCVCYVGQIIFGSGLMCACVRFVCVWVCGASSSFLNHSYYYDSRSYEIIANVKIPKPGCVIFTPFWKSARSVQNGNQFRKYI